MSVEQKYPPEDMSTKEIFDIVLDNDGTGSDIDADTYRSRSITDFVDANDIVNLVPTLARNNNIGYLIKKPTIILPINHGSNVLTPDIRSSAMETVDLYNGTHDKTDWQISLNSDFTNLVDEVKGSTTHLTTYVSTKLRNNTTYYLRCRYESDGNLSPWSDFVVFSTGAIVKIRTPRVFVVGGNNGVSTGPSFILEGFDTLQGYDYVVASEWKLVDRLGATILTRTINSGDVRYFSLPDGALDYDEKYTIYARYISLSAKSEWGLTTFTTESAPYLEDPVINIVGEPDSILTTPMVVLPPYVVVGSDELVNSLTYYIYNQYGTNILTKSVYNGQVNAFEIPLGYLNVDEEYTIKLQVSTPSYTSRMVTKSFTPRIQTGIKTPEILVDGHDTGARINLEPVISGGPFTTLGGVVDTHVSTSWEILKLDNSVHWSSMFDTVNLESITVPSASALDMDTEYIFKVTYHGGTLDSQTAIKHFTTINQEQVLTPKITAPTNGDVNVIPDPILKIELNNGVVDSNGTLYTTSSTVNGTLDVVEWKFTNVNNPAEVYIGTTNNLGDVTDVRPSTLNPAITLSYGTEYMIECKLVPQETNIVSSNYSQLVTITITSAPQVNVVLVDNDCFFGTGNNPGELVASCNGGHVDPISQAANYWWVSATYDAQENKTTAPLWSDSATLTRPINDNTSLAPYTFTGVPSNTVGYTCRYTVGYQNVYNSNEAVVFNSPPAFKSI